MSDQERIEKLEDEVKLLRQGLAHAIVAISESTNITKNMIAAFTVRAERQREEYTELTVEAVKAQEASLKAASDAVWGEEE